MTPGQQRAKDLQDEMREYQRMEDALREMTERNKELEAEVERLREALHNIEMNAENPVIRDMAEAALNDRGEAAQ